MTIRTQAELLLEAEALQLLGDHDTCDVWVESLDDDEFVLYQKWRNKLNGAGNWIITVRPADGNEPTASIFIFPLQMPSEEEIQAIKDATIDTFRKGLDILEMLSERVVPSFDSAFAEWVREKAQRLELLERISRLAQFLRLDDSHVAITRMKHLRQYAPRRR